MAQSTIENWSNQLFERSDIRREILVYLAEHPEAQDTAEGIAQWWILERCVDRHAPLVTEAIDYLVEKGLIVGRKARDSKIHYRINRRKARDVSVLVKRNPTRREQ